MLYPYKDDYEKIAMGLFSYVDHLKEPKRLIDEINWYQDEEDRQIYLWKSSETDDFVGIVGLEIEDELVLIRLISVMPSYRDEGVAHDMLSAVARVFSEYKIVGTLETAAFVSKWENSQSSSDQ